MDVKEMFKSEIENIHNENWRKAVLELVDKIPEYFWTVPASSSGKYHPKCDLGDGGLVRHSLMVTRCGLDLLDAEIFLRKSDINEDKVRIACLFHDCIKQGTGENGHTVSNHPVLASDFIRENLKIDDSAIEDICDAIYSHMGRWNSGKDENGNQIFMHKPRTDFELLIHTADYIASRKYIEGLEEWNNQ